MLNPDAAVPAQVGSALLRRALAFGFGLTLIAHGAFSETASLRFAIAGQPLANALNSYSTISGVELYYDGELVIGRRSSPIAGVLVPERALRELLVGTGLVARSTGPNSLTIAAARPSRLADTTVQSYFAAIQARGAQVLCTRAETRPGTIDVLIQLWLTSSGTIERASLLNSPDDGLRAHDFAAALQAVSIGAPTPDGLPQPITMAILAHAEGEPAGCARSSTAAAR